MRSALVAKDTRMRWTSTQLHKLAHTQLRGRRLVVVSNRKPYIHSDIGGEIACEQPASGMVSGLNAVLRACGGVWVAHGGGTADRRMVDAHDRLRVPPHHGIPSSVSGSPRKKKRAITMASPTRDSGPSVMRW